MQDPICAHLADCPARWQSINDSSTLAPAATRQSLKHAMAEPLLRRIAPDAAIASAVRLKMHGEIKLKIWIPFTAEQVVHWQRGFIGSATAWMNRLPIVGSDRIINGAGAILKGLNTTM